MNMIGTENHDDSQTIVCLHSSGSNGGQWRSLADYIGDDYTVLTPNLIGYSEDRFEEGDFLRIEHEVEAIAELIREMGGKAHLVGHSYGGAIATHIAIWYPELVASLTVYEPVLFSILYEDDDESPEVDEVEDVAKSIVDQIDSAHGRWRGARDFVNYWAGGDAWKSMSDRQHGRAAGLMPKVAAEFDALIKVGTSATSLGALRMPVRIYCGTKTRRSALRVAELFAEFACDIRLHLLEGLGHMAPITHADVINPLIVDHIIEAKPMDEAAVA
jgi:pimeloyl-ACP methyl ester carboxylesterase